MRARRDAGAPAADGAPIIGRSRPIQALLARIARVAVTDATVLILGERGTGKELVARAIQAQSRRRERPFVRVNCAAVPTELLASELFGHERGAFTGAHDRAPGLVRAADRGTLFLDEIGDLPLAAQAMLLRFLEEGEVRPVGSAVTVTVDVRILAATNRDLEDATARGTFRADLLDRLREVVVEVPSLAERGDDVTVLAHHFLVQQSRRHGRPVPRLGPSALRALRAHPWPGNVRELEHAISRAVIVAENGCVSAADLGLPDGAARQRARSATERGGVRPDASRTGSTDAGADPDLTMPSGLTPRQRAALHVAREAGVVRRADLMTRFGISSETARADLAREA